MGFIIGRFSLVIDKLIVEDRIRTDRKIVKHDVEENSTNHNILHFCLIQSVKTLFVAFGGNMLEILVAILEVTITYYANYIENRNSMAYVLVPLSPEAFDSY